MSGIAGVFNLDGSPVDGQALKAMTDVVAHRGPDGIGHWVQGPVGLGHLQLCTTPESLREQQPLVSHDGNCVIVWDGRLDNRKELLEDLRRTGPFSSDSTDVELVLGAYMVWGSDCAKHIIGDFGFAIWDSARRQLFCARDPIEMRLFHYHFDGRRFIFGTEIKQIFQAGDVPRPLNEVKLGLYLCGNFGDAEMTFYEGINRLPGGYGLVVSRQSLEKRVFWEPDPCDEIRFPTERDYAERFRELFFDATRSRLRSVGGVEVNLSGGVDSGAVASVAGHLRSNGLGVDIPLSVLTKVYRDPPLDESPYVRLIADRHEIPVTWLSVDDFWMHKPAATDADRDEPFPLPFEAMHCAAFESARERGIRVVLTGEGGDETAMPGRMLHIGDWLRTMRWWAVWRELRIGTPAYRRLAQAAIRRSLIPEWLRHLTGRTEVSISPWIRGDFVRRTGLTLRLRQLLPRSRRSGFYFQQRGRHPLFLGGDVRCARYGIELRHPFYDSRIVEFLARIPPQIRFRGGKSKVLLREAMTGVVPADVLVRASYGAFAPLGERGLRDIEAPRLSELLKGSRLAELGIVDADCLAEHFGSNLQSDDAKRGRLYWAFVTEEWLRQTRPQAPSQGTSQEAEPAGARSSVS